MGVYEQVLEEALGLCLWCGLRPCGSLWAVLPPCPVCVVLSPVLCHCGEFLWHQLYHWQALKHSQSNLASKCLKMKETGLFFFTSMTWLKSLKKQFYTLLTEKHILMEEANKIHVLDIIHWRLIHMTEYRQRTLT